MDSIQAVTYFVIAAATFILERFIFIGEGFRWRITKFFSAGGKLQTGSDSRMLLRNSFKVSELESSVYPCIFPLSTSSWARSAHRVSDFKTWSKKLNRILQGEKSRFQLSASSSANAETKKGKGKRLISSRH